MSGPRFRVVQLQSSHDRAPFKSGSEPLDHYFSQQVSQDIRRRVTACYVALTLDARIAGFYTLASAGLLLTELPASVANKLPRYPSVPTVRMGRLAVALEFKGQGLGGALLADALDRAIRSDLAAYALVVDAKDEAAVAFYRHHGLIALPSQPQTLFLPLASARSPGAGLEK
ncbi:MAG: GNAT family N-acetyltransferase [Burkholderiales bacterium RIFCSPHIGHO2_12_FULL_61_11]|nr:MAG: GNAT family N-acetyltransferase [Burkholderiales bacterium RIFCSPHIGHO2_12_FULL_61_11]